MAPDGRFLMIKSAATDAGGTPRVKVVVNWPSELEKLAPTN